MKRRWRVICWGSVDNLTMTLLKGEMFIIYPNSCKLSTINKTCKWKLLQYQINRYDQDIFQRLLIIIIKALIGLSMILLFFIWKRFGYCLCNLSLCMVLRFIQCFSALWLMILIDTPRIRRFIRPLVFGYSILGGKIRVDLIHLYINLMKKSYWI